MVASVIACVVAPVTSVIASVVAPVTSTVDTSDIGSVTCVLESVVGSCVVGGGTVVNGVSVVTGVGEDVLPVAIENSVTSCNFHEKCDLLCTSRNTVREVEVSDRYCPLRTASHV